MSGENVEIIRAAFEALTGETWTAPVGLGAGMIVGVLGLAAIGAYGGRRTQTA